MNLIPSIVYILLLGILFIPFFFLIIPQPFNSYTLTIFILTTLIGSNFDMLNYFLNLYINIAIFCEYPLLFVMLTVIFFFM